MTKTSLSITSNIDKFNFAALELLNTLHSVFPVAQRSFAPGRILTDRVPNGTSSDIFSEFSDLGYHTFLWLRHAGFVLGNPGGTGFISDACLTLKGYALLHGKGEKVGPIQLRPVIDQMTEALQAELSQIDKKKLSEIMERLVREMAFS